MTKRMMEIADNADMIVSGYAFTIDTSGCRVVDLEDMDRAMVINAEDEVIETTMDDIEISVVMELYNRNKVFLEERNAKVL